MIDSLLGAVIMVAATSSLVLALQVAERALDEAGRYPLSSDEGKVLRRAGVSGTDGKQKFQNVLDRLPTSFSGAE